MKVHEIITDKVINALGQKQVPWVKGWSAAHAFNAVSRRRYNGLNALMLDNTPLGYITMKKIQELGGKLEKGSKGNFVAFWTFIENRKAEKVNGEFPKIPMLRYYNVFRVDNVSDLPEKFYVPATRSIKTLAAFDEMVKRHDVKVTFSGNRAVYSPSLDAITLPHKEQFKSTEEFYGTYAHELIHWTAKRLGRELSQEDTSYAQEELIAEIGSCMLIEEFGLTPKIENSAAYCSGWANKIKADQWLVVRAATRAEKAVKFLLGETE